MDPREALARLSGGSIDPGRVPGGSGGGLRPEDVAAAMAGAPRGAALLLRAKYCLDATSLPALEREAMQGASALAARHDWRLTPERLQALVHLALEHVVSAKTCRHCHGRGSRRRRGGLLVECEACAGTGRGELSEAERARRADVDPTRWHRLWRVRWRAIVTLIERWEAEGLAVVRVRLGLGLTN